MNESDSQDTDNFNEERESSSCNEKDGAANEKDGAAHNFNFNESDEGGPTMGVEEGEFKRISDLTVDEVCALQFDNEEDAYQFYNKFDNERMLILLDSYPSEGRREHRRLSVKKLASFLDKMLDENDIPSKSKYDISSFTLVEPKGLPRQQFGSDDCGVWVVKWMIECASREDFDEVFVRPDSRLRIAIDMVTHPFNGLRENVQEKAIEYWTKLKRRRNATYDV